VGKTKDIRAAFTLLEQLETVERRLDKEALLRSGRDNPVLQQIVKLVLGNRKFYVHITPRLTRCSAELSLWQAWAQFVHLLGRLERRELVGTKAKLVTKRLLLKTDSSLAKWLLRILDHNLHIGVSAKTISSVWGKEFLYEGAERGAERFTFRGCMLSKPRKDLPKKDAVLPFPLGGEWKLDGERFLGFVWPNDGVVEIVSRRNLRASFIESVKPFAEQMIAAAAELGHNGEPVFLDGEFLARRATPSGEPGWNKTASIIRRTTNFDPKWFLAEVSAVLWDWMPLKCYQEGRWDAPWLKRKHHLLSLVSGLDLKHLEPTVYEVSRNLAVLGHKILRSEAELEPFYRSALDHKVEGVITKQLGGPHIVDGHRSALSVKHKPEDAATGVILRALRGKTGTKNGAATSAQIKQALKVLRAAGEVKDDGYYFCVLCPSEDRASKLGAKLRQATQDSAFHRVLVNAKRVYYRYSARLGSFEVAGGKKGEIIFHIGGGIKEGDGTDPKLDQRMMLWKRRRQLPGRKIDWKFQADPNKVAKFRFNTFVRFRDDL
jgi:hypothetical protein